MVYTEAGKRASIKYRKSHVKRIPLDVSIPEHEQIKKAAERVNESINGYIKESIRQRIQRENAEDPEE